MDFQILRDVEAPNRETHELHATAPAVCASLLRRELVAGCLSILEVPPWLQGDDRVVLCGLAPPRSQQTKRNEAQGKLQAMWPWGKWKAAPVLDMSNAVDRMTC